MLAGIAIDKKRRDEANVVFRTVVSTMAAIAVIATVVGWTMPQTVTLFFCTDVALQSLGAIEKGKGGQGFGEVVKFTYLLLTVS